MRPRRVRLAIVSCLAVCLATSTLRSTPPPAQLPYPLPLPKQSERACRAGKLFWEVFNGNEYCKVDAVIAELTAAHQETPCDARLNGLLGSAHLWKFMERRRVCKTGPEFRDHVVSAQRHMASALRIDPNIRAIKALEPASRVALAVLDNDPARLEQALDDMRRNTKADPNFHGFVQGFTFAHVYAHDDPRYPEAIEGYFATLDNCMGFRVPRGLPIPVFGPLLQSWLAARALRDPGCYNTEVAPHNLEATLLGLADAYLKQGKLTQARNWYASTKRIRTYPDWFFKDQVDHRLQNLEALRDKFRSDPPNREVAEPVMYSSQSTYACSACHAR